MLVHSLDLTPDSDDLMDSFDELFLTCMLSELYLHVYLHLCTSHMARRKTASCHAKATIHLALVEAAVASDTPLATFQVGRGLHQRAVSFFSRPCIRIYTSTHLHIYKPGIPLASDMQPRSHPSPPDVCSSAAGLTVYHRHTDHSTVQGPAQYECNE
jgi:hypothetical protein